VRLTRPATPGATVPRSVRRDRDREARSAPSGRAQRQASPSASPLRTRSRRRLRTENLGGITADEDIASIARQLAELTHTVEEMAAELKSCGSVPTLNRSAPSFSKSAQRYSRSESTWQPENSPNSAPVSKPRRPRSVSRSDYTESWPCRSNSVRRSSLVLSATRVDVYLGLSRRSGTQGQSDHHTPFASRRGCNPGGALASALNSERAKDGGVFRRTLRAARLAASDKRIPSRSDVSQCWGRAMRP
jgi:hypothetical protein